ncbi:MAG: hypothetical protein BMS9Abin37_2526 [Acidobacteriota bacterium]|nr:MAG: hypothetical protein BMS9Abin37_2526 [Acidobacteriota bacterium]
MKSTLMVLLVLLPGLALGQSLTEVAKKEKERREKNKQEGKEALVISEDQLSSEQAVGGSGQVQVEGGSTRSAGPPRPGSYEGDDGEEYDEESEYMEEDVPKSIPPDIPLEQRLEMFQRMKRHYEKQVREIDNAIAENNERLRQLEAKIGATSALGGAGLPVALQTGTGAANTQMTGQESQQLIAEQKRLQAMNTQMESRKDQLKLDLQTKGRVAGIPPGYLRF